MRKRRLTIAILTIGLTLTPGMALAAEDASPAAGAFSPAGSLPEGHNGHTATLLPDGRVLIVGGGKADARASANTWHPETSTFERAGSLKRGRGSHTASLLPDGRVLVVGGGRAIPKAEAWDPDTATFEPAGRLLQPRAAHTATTLPDGRVLIVGGWKRPGWLASAEIWEPATASFVPTGSLAAARVGHTATLLPDGRVLVVGGHGADRYEADAAGNLLYPEEARASAEAWDPATGTFTPVGTLEVPRSQHAAALLPDGRVLVVGGGSEEGDTTLAEIWDPTTEMFSPAGWQTESAVSATALPDGRVLAIDDQAAEVWEPTVSAFIPAGKLTVGRWPHSATLLSDGRVLVIGGQGVEARASAEAWEPRELPDEVLRDLAAKSSVCGELRASFRSDGTTGDTQRDVEYLTRCVACDELMRLLQFGIVADMEMGLALHEEQCG